jgi:small-conductance mechanosensitive channel
VLAELDDLARAVERIGEETARIRERQAALPAERDQAGRMLAEADREVAERRVSHEEAQDGASASDDPAAQRAEVRAHDLLHSAKRRAMHARAEVERLDHERGKLAEEERDLHGRATEIAARLAEGPGLSEAAGRAPEDTLDQVVDWATEARAALLVARSSLTAQRDAMIRQANELGALVLGEPLTARSPAAVRAQLETRSG